jgi:EAL domain-containing protein (putative c-di-GMP-specific phosphodiesterase class I)
VFNLSTDALIGAEALVRWEHPTRGLLAPVEFIPLAEETGLIVPLGEAVTRAALGQLAAWDSAEHWLHVPLLAVNFSAVQLARSNFGSAVSNALSDSGVDPGRLCAEITETVLMANNETTRASVADLKHLGVRIAIDDFGTGYSSLAYLEELPAEILKIDRRFVAGLGPAGSVAGSIVKAVVDIAHALGLTVIAEGVEEHGQFEFLRRCGCDSGQGYLWARPMPAEQFAAWVTQRENFLERSTGSGLVSKER